MYVVSCFLSIGLCEINEGASDAIVLGQHLTTLLAEFKSVRLKLLVHNHLPVLRSYH